MAAGQEPTAAAVVDMTAAVAPDAGKAKPQQEEPKPVESVPFRDLFFFATSFDWLLVRRRVFVKGGSGFNGCM